MTNTKRILFALQGFPFVPFLQLFIKKLFNSSLQLLHFGFQTFLQLFLVSFKLFFYTVNHHGHLLFHNICHFLLMVGESILKNIIWLHWKTIILSDIKVLKLEEYKVNEVQYVRNGSKNNGHNCVSPSTSNWPTEEEKDLSMHSIQFDSILAGI